MDEAMSSHKDGLTDLTQNRKVKFMRCQSEHY